MVTVQSIFGGFFLYNFTPRHVGKTEVRIITVQDEGQPVTGLNELEYIGNEIWSNVFMVSDPSQLQNVW
jgi:glutamine cyclotransferase